MLYGALWDYCVPYGVSVLPMGPYGAVWGRMGSLWPYGALWGRMGPYGVSECFMGPYGVPEPPMGPYGAVWGV